MSEQKELYNALITAIVLDMKKFGMLTEKLAKMIDVLLDKQDFPAIYDISDVRRFVASQCRQFKNYPKYLLTHFVKHE